MKFSKILHISGVIVGLAGIGTALIGVAAGTETIWGLSREHLFLCSGLLMLIAIFLAVSTVHHVLLENKGEVL